MTVNNLGGHHKHANREGTSVVFHSLQQRDKCEETESEEIQRELREVDKKCKLGYLCLNKGLSLFIRSLVSLFPTKIQTFLSLSCAVVTIHKQIALYSSLNTPIHPL